ncbi:MAG: hypothetical protein JO057_09280 [Chloroflexi bacterium]|nr:hypothetical protein [Chloroflexota bacterium]
MTLPMTGAHNAVPPYPFIRVQLPTPSSGVCRCGAVFDYGNVAVPSGGVGLCGRCARIEQSPLRGGARGQRSPHAGQHF